MEICVDFDGTCTTHEYPRIGKDIGSIPVLKKLIDNGHKLIIFTMRGAEELDAAVNWFEENGIPLYGIQKNPSQRNWTDSPKAYGQLYIDDAALGCPLIHGKHLRPYVDWVRVEELLIEQGIIKPKTEENV